jgi:hypothetical protein
MPEFSKVDQLRINGNNYDRTRTSIEIAGVTIKGRDITNVVKGISYSETADIQFDYSLGSRRPTAIGFGNIVSEGSITLSDAGIALLNDIATDSGLPSLTYLGQSGAINITVSYTTYNGIVKTDVLESVFFTNYNNGVNTDDVLYSREIPLMIGKITIGANS